ncbi:BON domain-containing protein [Paraburkholderia sp. BL10I2N1]|uniref:BON domain-containing protein n=1 Tax=Paraburkholderia sp. BL10I2N1 TaxID=1938796 RepID=UPI001060D424|nr:BON domain-containing protein [Paraburkholderia sp. BL10I2N1]
MKTSGAIRIIGAIAAVATCAVFATYADAQTSGGTAPGASTQSQPITTSSSRRRPDSELVRDVRRALSRASGVNASGIHVQARNGVVTLTGRVPQRAQVQRAGSVARSVRGVRSVSNRLTVQTRGGNSR